MNDRSCDAVGIDLGTTYSALAYMDAQMVPRIVQDSSGHAVVPSVVFFDDDEVIVGDIALQQSKLRADRVVQHVKVHMGDEWRRDIRGTVHTPESISAIILAHLLREAEPQIGPSRRAVITVPAYFTEKRRRATAQAGEIAGLTVIGTLNEPVSAALAYGLHREDREQRVVVYDLGGGTFDVTVVRVTPTELEELASNGNRQLGGRDWDQCLIDAVLDDYRKAHGVDLRNAPDSLQALQDVQLECEQAKRRLGKMAKTTVPVKARGVDHKVEVTREQFEAATAHLLQATRLTTEMALDDAGLGWDQIARVVLVGGSTQMPMVRQMLQRISGKPPDAGVNPVTAVALGAAIYAHVLETGKGPKAVRVKDAPAAATTAAVPAATPTVSVGPTALPDVHFVTAHGVGVMALRTNRWVNSVLIPKNTRVPAAAKREFTTRATGTLPADRIRIRVTQGDTDNPDLAEVLGTATFSGIPKGQPSGLPVRVALEFDEQGRLHLKAVYVATGQSLTMSLEIPGCLREEEVREYRKMMAASGLIPESLLPVDDDLPVLDDDEELPLLEPE